MNNSACLLSLNDRRKVVLYDGKIYKSFKDREEMLREWNFINVCHSIYQTRYTREAQMMHEPPCIVFPLLKPVKEVDRKLISDVGKQLVALNKNGVMHLDVSKDNIVYDQIDDKYYLIDYGNSIFTKDIGKVSNVQYKPKYRNPEGLTVDSDIVALSIIESEMGKKGRKNDRTGH